MADIITEKIFEKYLPKEARQETIWVIGISGGADSLCLTLLADRYAKKYNIKIIACFVDHKLRQESSDEIKPVTKLLEKRGIQYEIYTWKHKEITTGIEAKAREARYNFLYECSKRYKAKILMTAHHALDQWETFFMRLSRGSALKGLTSIRESSNFKDITLVRPMLHFTPNDIKETLKTSFNVDSYVKDPSNESDEFERVRWRKSYSKLSVEYGLDINNINKTIARLQNAQDAIDKISKNIKDDVFNNKYIKLNIFSQQPEEIRIRVLEQIILSFTKTNKILSYNLLKKVASDLTNKNFVATNFAGIVLKKDKTKNIKLFFESRKN